MTQLISGECNSEHGVDKNMNHRQNGHVPASPLVSDDIQLPFPELCARIHDRITAFLDEKHVSPRLQSVQEQTRVSLKVIAEALERYRYVRLPYPNPVARPNPTTRADKPAPASPSSPYPTMAGRTVLSF